VETKTYKPFLYGFLYAFMSVSLLCAQVEPEKNPGPKVELSGFVDGAYFYDGNSGANTFSLDQVEIDVIKSVSKTTVLRADLEWVNDGAGGFALDAEQGFIQFSPLILGGLNVTFGKFNAPIGFELLDAPDMYQYSHALVFDYGLPTNLTGAMFSKNIGENVDVVFYFSNGWDQNVDINKSKTIGGRIGYSRDDDWKGGLSFIRGEERENNSGLLTVLDADFTFTAVKNLTLGAEINKGGENLTDSTNTSKTVTWLGALLMAHYDFSEFWGITVRYDYFDDKNGSRLGNAEKRQALTFAPTFVLGDGMVAIFEVRNDFSDKKVFTGNKGEAVKSQLAMALEFTFTF
jgi:Putative beta-barrel porin-2, OmpL-like. bbp2